MSRTIHGLWGELPKLLQNIEGPTMTFEVVRDEETRAAQPGTTFSPEAFDRMIDQIHLWVGSRLYRDLTKNGEGKEPTHEKLRVTVTVEIDGREEGGVPLAIEVVDGTVRISAIEKDSR